ncbi:MAG: hypothetical protein JSS14_21850 [Proteobacteria bacterium]|nr:hypothetical protein [Pseudomonadota bacterium]
MNIDREAAEAAAATVAAKVTPYGTAGAIVGWLASSEVTIILGLLIAVGGFVVNWYYKAKADRRSELVHELRVARLRQGLDADTERDELDE